MTLVSYDFTSSIPGGVTVNSSPAGFAKTSSGSLTSFSANAGRRTDLGLLIEPSATNLWLSNIDQSTGQWSSPSLGTVTQNNATAPDGTTTADSYLETASNGQHCPYPAAAISVSGSTNYTTSAYVKSTGGRHAYIQIANQSFSVASVAFLPPTLIASIYGMNFRVLPELNWSFGYPFAIVLMIASAITPFWYFRKRGWLK